MFPSNLGTPPARRATGLVTVAASAGGVSALCTLLAALPTGLPVAVAIVQHRSATVPSALAKILGRASRWPVKPVRDGEAIAEGQVYLAPPDEHLTVTPEKTFRLLDGRRIRYVLSSANPLFETAAASFGERLIAVVLTGGDSDGTDGVQTVARAGGLVIAQNPATAQHAPMPRSAIATGAVSAVLPLEGIAGEITRRVGAWRTPAGDPSGDGPRPSIP